MASLPNPDFQLIESILWQDRFFLLSEHLQRLEDSSRTLGFAFDRESTEVRLAYFARTSLTKEKRVKVRLLVFRDGSSSVSAEEILTRRTSAWKIAMSAQPTDRGDVFLYHKTTNRSLYDSELKKYRLRGFDEILFRNKEGEITEGSISNILAKINGSWVTPDVQCGLLAGVYRGRLLNRMKGRLQTARISMRNLQQAERILLCNSVRGCITVGRLDS